MKSNRAAFTYVPSGSSIKNAVECTNGVAPASLWKDWNPDEAVTVIEGIAMAANLHATTRGARINTIKKTMECRCDFEDPSVLVGPFDRNEHGVSLGYLDGKIENSVLAARAIGRHDNPGIFNPQIWFTGLEFPAKDFNRVSFRMKRDFLPNTDPDALRQEVAKLYFSTSLSQSFSEDKCVYVDLNQYSDDLSQWFDVEVELGEHPQWKDMILNFRLDPTNNNGIYYLDYIVFSKSDKIDNSAWYDAYLDYAVENSLITRETFKQNDYSRSITGYEFFDLLAKALPEACYNPTINSIRGIPDVSRDLKNSDSYLMLYNAGITLGADDKGSFHGDADIKAAEAIAVINRIEHPETRLKGSVACDWSAQGAEFDLEFDDAACLDKLELVGNHKVENGALVMEALDGGADVAFDSQICWKNVRLNAERFFKLRVRMKAEVISDARHADFGFYFKTEGDSEFTESKSFHGDFVEKSYIDPTGWYVIEVNLSESAAWRGIVTGMRFVPSDKNGVYTIDYMRLIKRAPLFNASHDELMAHGYKCHGMLQDNDFENGFVVCHYEQKPIDRTVRVWNDYSQTDKAPCWDLMSMWTTHDLWDNRDYSVDKYTLADTLGINKVIYNPEEKSLSLRLNATEVYHGKAHDANFSWWPHLLLNQYYGTYPVDAVKNSAAADRMFVELDMRVRDFKPTTNKNGQNSCAFLLFFYFITDKAPHQKIWYGITLFNDVQVHTSRTPAWVPDSAAHQYIFALTQDIVYDGLANSFLPCRDKPVVGDEWKHIRVDITDYIDQCLEWANRDKAFGYGLHLTKEDMYFGGCNIGFEIHGNYDCTVEFKNLDMIAYNK